MGKYMKLKSIKKLNLTSIERNSLAYCLSRMTKKFRIWKARCCGLHCLQIKLHLVERDVFCGLILWNYKTKLTPSLIQNARGSKCKTNSSHQSGSMKRYPASQTRNLAQCMKTSSNGNISALLALCAGNSPHKGQWRGASKFPSVCAWTNICANNRGASELISHRAHYDVTVIQNDSVKCTPIKRLTIFRTRHACPWNSHFRFEPDCLSTWPKRCVTRLNEIHNKAFVSWCRISFLTQITLLIFQNWNTPH